MVLREQSHLWRTHIMVVITPLEIMSVDHGYYRFMTLTREYFNVNALLKSWFDLLKRDFGHIIELDT